MAVFDVNVVISLTNIKFDKVMSVFQLVYKVRDKRKGVCITSGVLIEVVVILIWMKLAVFLFDKEERRCLKRVGRTNLLSS